MDAWQEQLDSIIEAQAAEIVAVRRHLHAHPEPSGEEVETTLFLHSRLAPLGLKLRFGPERRGLVVDSVPHPGIPRVALRADIDALRIQELNTAEYASRRPGVMHACGHDAHAAAVFGALLGLHGARRDRVLPWPVNWRALFQPAEETAGGAADLIELGVLEGVDSILSLHMDPSRETGRIGLRVGPLTAACDEITISVYGRGGHAARPHESLDPLAVAAHLVTSIYQFIPRSVDAHEPVVVTIGQFQAGDNANVIPESALLRGTVRTLHPEARERTLELIGQIARGAAEASGARIEVEFTPGPPPVLNDSRLVGLLQETGMALLGPRGVDWIPRPSMGGEDFAFYLERVPGAMFRLGCSLPDVTGHSLHSAHFDLDEQSLVVGAKVLARAAVLRCDPERDFGGDTDG